MNCIKDNIKRYGPNCVFSLTLLPHFHIIISTCLHNIFSPPVPQNQAPTPCSQLFGGLDCLLLLTHTHTQRAMVVGENWSISLFSLCIYILSRVNATSSHFVLLSPHMSQPNDSLDKSPQGAYLNPTFLWAPSFPPLCEYEPKFWRRVDENAAPYA